MIYLTEYIGDDCGQPLLVDPAAIACIRSYAWHSFRPRIGEIVLRTGDKVRVWEDVARIETLVQQATQTIAASGEWTIVSVDFEPDDFPGCTAIVVQGSLLAVGAGDRVAIRKASEEAGQ